MTRKELLPLVLATTLGCFTRLPVVAPHEYLPPAATSEKPLQVCWLETAGTEAWGGFGSAGASKTCRWQVTASALLVRHPNGDVLIDTGNSPKLDEELREVSLLGRFITSNLFGRFEERANLTSLLAQAGLASSDVDSVILSHVHGDHAGGVSLLPGVPILLPKPELEFARQGLKGSGWRVLPAHARVIARQGVELKFDDGPYANFDRSHDVFGDQSVVVVPLFGHTPGSVGVFVNMSSTRRLLHVGDVVNTKASLERSVRKSWIMRTLTDDDDDLAAAQIARLVELHHADPMLHILPAHDRGAWKGFFGELPEGQSMRCVESPQK